MNNSYINSDDRNIINKILQLKKEKDVLIFSHNYQTPEILKVADIIGDSLYLAKKAGELPGGSRIIYASVRFMAETAVLLNEDIKVYHPSPDSLCPMARMLDKDELIRVRRDNPGIPIVLYINSTTTCKQYADVICTSSNAVQICKKIAEERGVRKLFFGPDKNLGKWVEKKSGLKIETMPENGCCFLHDGFVLNDILSFKEKYSDSIVLVHPEVPSEVSENADKVGSTSEMYNYVMSSPDEIFGLGTEVGLYHRIKMVYLELKVYPLRENALCKAMKRITPEKVLYALETLDEETMPIVLDDDLKENAKKPIFKMFELMNLTFK